MATPFPFASGDVLTAANLNATADVPRVLVTNTTDQALSSPALNTISFNQETYDTHGMHDTATNNSRLTAPTGWAGYYFVWAEGVCTVNDQNGALLKNGSGTPYIYGIGGSGMNRPAAMGLIPLNAGDYVEFANFSGGGGNMYGTSSLGGNSPAFGAIWVAPL